MDTSETYIKMSSEARKYLLPRCEGKYGDFYAEEVLDRYCPRCKDYVDKYHRGQFCSACGAKTSDRFTYRPNNSSRDIPLYRQDQLQEMVIEIRGSVEELLFGLNYWYRNHGPEKYQSFEQLWLAFVMKEKYNKVWNGEDWINA